MSYWTNPPKIQNDYIPIKIAGWNVQRLTSQHFNNASNKQIKWWKPTKIIFVTNVWYKIDMKNRSYLLFV